MSKKDLRKAAEGVTQTAADRAAQALNDLADYLGPRFDDARDQLEPLVRDAQAKVKPLAKDAKDRLADAQSKVGPLLADASKRVQPAVENAREQLADTYQTSIRPKLSDLWDKAQENDTVAEATNRGAAAFAALKGEHYLPAPVKPEILQPAHKGRKVVGRDGGDHARRQHEVDELAGQRGIDRAQAFVTVHQDLQRTPQVRRVDGAVQPRAPARVVGDLAGIQAILHPQATLPGRERDAFRSRLRPDARARGALTCGDLPQLLSLFR